MVHKSARDRVGIDTEWGDELHRNERTKRKQESSAYKLAKALATPIDQHIQLLPSTSHGRLKIKENNSKPCHGQSLIFMNETAILWVRGVACSWHLGRVPSYGAEDEGY